MRNSTLHICDTAIHPGEAANLALPLPEQYACSKLYMPIRILHGQQAGPCVVVFSTLRGCELNGMEIANRLVQSLEPSDIHGTLIAIPVLNVYGLTHYPHNLPSEERLEECFPGTAEGTYGERIAWLFTQEILKKADCCIELQTGDQNHHLLPQVYGCLEQKPVREMAKAFQAPVITKVALDSTKLRQTTEQLRAPLLVYQAGEAMRFDEASIQTGVQGIQHVMAHLGMIKEEPHDKFTPMFSDNEFWMTAQTAGLLHTEISLGQMVQENQRLGYIADPFGLAEPVPIFARSEGIIVGINTTPLVHEGMSILKVASFLDMDRAEAFLEEWERQRQELEEDGSSVATEGEQTS